MIEYKYWKMSNESENKLSIQATVILGALLVLIPIHIIYMNGMNLTFYDKILDWTLGPNGNKQVSAYYSMTFMIYLIGTMHLKDNRKYVNISFVIGCFWIMIVFVSSFIWPNEFVIEIRRTMTILFLVATLLWWLDTISLKRHNRTCKLVFLTNLNESTKYDLIHRSTPVLVVVSWFI